MEQQPVPRVPPSEFRRQSRFVGFVGLAMDILVATVILAFRPFDRDLTYVLIAALIGAGVVMTYVFAVLFPNKYERYYNHLLERNI